MTWKVICQLQAFSSANHQALLQHFARFFYHRVCAVPQRQLGFLYQMLFSSVSKMVELKENEIWFSMSVTILTPAQNFSRRFGLLSKFFDLLFRLPVGTAVVA